MKVDIEIIEGCNYAQSVKNGAEYTSVRYSGRIYGGASPCDSEDEVKRQKEEIEKAVKDANEKIAELRDNKEKELMTV